MKKYMIEWTDGYICNVINNNGQWYFMGAMDKYNSLEELSASIQESVVSKTLLEG